MTENQQQNDTAAAEAEAKAAAAQKKAKAKSGGKTGKPAVRQLEIVTSCGVGGVDVEEGEIYAVPDDISEADAKILVRMKRAQWVEK